MMTRQGLRRFDCCPGHNPRSYDHGRERAREHREWRREATPDLPSGIRSSCPLP
ncbi:hypothetical protein [Streptomyces sp. NPDC051662]|uniref:hypothetical protein n=1 Tax=Streptomyces sp. NPDC051662 TaxID=3154750 RepID=UPI0034338791